MYRILPFAGKYVYNEMGIITCKIPDAEKLELFNTTDLEVTRQQLHDGVKHITTVEAMRDGFGYAYDEVLGMEGLED